MARANDYISLMSVFETVC